MPEPLEGEILTTEDLALDEENERRLRRMVALEKLLDRQFSLAGFRFGWDSLAGLIPVLGDTLTTALSAWIIWEAHKAGAPNHLKARMIAHAGLDYLIGLVPLAGDIGDVFYRANTRNVRLLKRHLEEKRASGAPRRKP
ncbi:uncharacterized protein DUF4112 [Mesorhizobium sp. J18]|uniref:DUF4112 domain-containing protein n=1 Tax=Mesorhizobium sp. J18 TaxID=935263 RepID=UPI00119B0C7A|nr:DUF4112 domain-containing protein [Mesorhizobium sp. J18]TWG94868.1 uncharacterized protein DUF4112 [Mesorhizobium sp. J18]